MTTFGPALPSLSELSPGVRRLLAPNPSMMTGPGTNTYLFGTREIAVLDPGPAIDAHIDRIQAEAGAPIRWVLVTHTHPDHSPAAMPLAAATGAELLGRPAPDGDHLDASFHPHRVLEDDDVFSTDEFELRAVHTPGHASNHLCYLHAATLQLFTGDHVIDGSTVVIDPPDGNMRDYLDSLRKIRALRCASLAPGHGDVIGDPDRVIDWTIAHRLAREQKVISALAGHPRATAGELVPHVYTDVDTSLFGLAERSLLAHLLKLEQDGAAGRDGDRWTGRLTNGQ